MNKVLQVLHSVLDLTSLQLITFDLGLSKLDKETVLLIECHGQVVVLLTFLASVVRTVSVLAPVSFHSVFLQL